VTTTTSVAWEQRLRSSPRLNLSYVYRFERNHTYDTQPPPGDVPFDIRVDLARVTGSAAWDTRDDPADTTRGTLVSTSLEFAAQRLGSDFAYVRSLSQAYHFRPVKRLVLASAARYGIVEPREGQDLIPSLRFFAGGARTVRGVDEDSLGERDFFGDPAGGQTLLVLNQEARFPIYRWLRGVGFLDVGSVFAEPRIRLGELTASVGGGLRVMTPFGILRADFAKTLTSGPVGSGRVTFGIGQAF
jgi:outer membrane protein assembly factor BamA